MINDYPVKEKGVASDRNGWWIPFHTNTRTNAKIKKGSKLLGISLPTMLGHMALLWTWVMEHRTEGSLAKFDNDDIAMAAMWEGNPDDFVNTLVKVRLLENTPEDGLFVHEWEQYGGKIDKEKEARANRAAVRRAGERGELPTPDSLLVSEGLSSLPSRNSHVTVTYPARDGYVTPKRREEETTQEKDNSSLASETQQRSRFEIMMGDDAIKFFSKSLSHKIPGFTEMYFRTILRAASDRCGEISEDELNKRLADIRLLADQVDSRQKSPNPQRRLINPLVWAIKAMNARMSGENGIENLL